MKKLLIMSTLLSLTSFACAMDKSTGNAKQDFIDTRVALMERVAKEEMYETIQHAKDIVSTKHGDHLDLKNNSLCKEYGNRELAKPAAKLLLFMEKRGFFGITEEEIRKANESARAKYPHPMAYYEIDDQESDDESQVVDTMEQRRRVNEVKAFNEKRKSEALKDAQYLLDGSKSYSKSYEEVCFADNFDGKEEPIYRFAQIIKALNHHGFCGITEKQREFIDRAVEKQPSVSAIPPHACYDINIYDQDGLE